MSITSRSAICTLFWDSESLWKSNGKKWSQIWKLMLGEGLKSSTIKKKVFFADIPLQSMAETKHFWVFFILDDFLGLKKNIFFGIFGPTTVHCGGVIKGRVCCCGCSCNDMWRVTCDRWHMTCDTWQLTGDMLQVTGDRWQVTCDRWQVTCERFFLFIFFLVF